MVALLARGLSRSMHISGAEALSTVGDIFLGMTEAPLLIRPYVARMTESELFAVMCAGMATISGSVLLAYVAMGVDAGYLVTASFMSAPAAVMFAKIMIPETGVPETSDARARRGPAARRQHRRRGGARRGEGLQLALNVGGMLIAFVALVSMCDKRRRLAGRPGSATPAGRWVAWLGAPLTPLAWVMGVPWSEAPFVGSAARHEDGAQRVHRLPDDDQPRRRCCRSRASASPASRSAASPTSGRWPSSSAGLGGMVPERRKDLARLGIRSIIAGSLATFLTGTIAGLIAP